MEEHDGKKRVSAVDTPAAVHSTKPSFAVEAHIFGRSVRLLVDTGADVSLLPSHYKHKAFPLEIKLTTANACPVQTYGCIATYIRC